jgi:Uma2 family endonuclease
MLSIASPPLLREGDRLNSKEFLRRWEAMPELKHAELIEGVVFMPSPLSDDHGSIHLRMATWLGSYADETPGCGGGLESTWVMGEKSAPQPDLHLRILPEFGGQSSRAGVYCAGAPELIVEVSGSTLSRDLGAKLELYRRSGVREYLSVLLSPRQIIWRELIRGKYREIAASEDGLLRSRVFPGLWLDPDAVWNSKKRLSKAVGQGVKSMEHAAFLRKLAAARKRT